MSSDGSDYALEPSSLFKEPEDFYPPEKPATFSDHTLLSGQTLHLRLVGHDPLWGHLLWNASRITASYLESHSSRLVKNKTILELGAGAGLPSLVCALHGAAKVVVTDYPDDDLIQNLRYNIEHCAPASAVVDSIVVAEGYLWGTPPSTLLSHIPLLSSPFNDPPTTTTTTTTTAAAAAAAADRRGGFDLLILADLLFNHSEHRKLVLSIQKTLKHTPEARALAFFTPHRPWLFERDMAFFDLAREAGFVVEKVLERRMEQAMVATGPVRRSVFDTGDEEMRKVVLGWELRWGERGGFGLEEEEEGR